MIKPMTHAIPTSGSTYEYTGKRNWKASKDDRWEIEMYGTTGNEIPVGIRTIDGSEHAVYKCPDGKFRAILSHLAR